MYQRLSSESYDYNQPVWSGTGTSASIDNLTEGSAYHFVVRAFSGADESGDSNEVDYTPPNTNPSPANQTPVSDAGSDQTVVSAARVTLNGSGSSDPDGDTLSYTWAQTGGTTVALSSRTSSTPSFTAPTVSSGSITLVFTLTVTDPSGAVDMDQCQITVEAPAPVNHSPVANAGGNQTVFSQALVTLNGTGSSDPDGDTLRYAWVQSSGTAVVLSTISQASFSFSAPSVSSGSQTLVFTLTVTDPTGAVDSDQCQVTVEAAAPNNQTPVADAGANQTVSPQSPVTLNGSGSHDPENQPLSYLWHQTNGPAVAIAHSNSVQATFTSPDGIAQTTTLAFELTVSDSQGASSSDTCLVVVEPSTSSDSDGDGIADATDAFPNDPNEWVDTDHDGIGNNADTDDDNDGMPDAWETQYGLDPLHDDSGADADGDGISNLEEYQAGSDPTTAETDNHPPATPTILSPADGDTVVYFKLKVRSSSFIDSDQGDQHAKTHWQIIDPDQQRLVMDKTVDKRDLTSIWVPRLILDPGKNYTCRVRYVDDKGGKSDWSPEVHFTTQAKSNGGGKPNNKDAIMDLNADQIDDSQQTDIIASIDTYDGTRSMAVSIENGGNATKILDADAFDPADLEQSAPCDNQELPYGMMGYKIEVAEAGQTATLELLYSEPIDAHTHWYRYNSITGWQDLTQSVDVNADGKGARHQVTDGGEDDADGVANGLIVELVAPRSATGTVDGTNGDSSSGTGLSNSDSATNGGVGAGCFLQSLMP